MSWARIGGVLLILSGVLGLLVSVLAGPGPQGVLSGLGFNPFLLSAPSALLGAIGAGVVSLTRPARLEPRLTRLGLALIGIGLLGVSMEIFLGPTAAQSFLASWPSIRHQLGDVLMVSLLGWPVIGLSLVRSPGIPRVAGFLVLGGVLFQALSIAVLLSGSVDVAGLTLVSATLLNAGLAGVGLLALGVGAPVGEAVPA